MGSLLLVRGQQGESPVAIADRISTILSIASIAGRGNIKIDYISTPWATLSRQSQPILSAQAEPLYCRTYVRSNHELSSRSTASISRSMANGLRM